jgi:hypothetical protein
MQTLHPDVFVVIELPYEPRSRNVQPGRYGRRRKEGLSQGRFFEDSPACGLTSALFQTQRIDKRLHL